MLGEHDFSAYGRFDSQLRHFVPHAAAEQSPGGGFSFNWRVVLAADMAPCPKKPLSGAIMAGGGRYG